MAQWTKRLTRNGQKRVRIREAHIIDITPVTEKTVLTTNNGRNFVRYLTRKCITICIITTFKLLKFGVKFVFNVFAFYIEFALLHSAELIGTKFLLKNR